MAWTALRRTVTATILAVATVVAGAGLPAGNAVLGPVAALLGPAVAHAAGTLGQPQFAGTATLVGYGSAGGGAPATADCGPEALTAITGHHDDPGDYLRGVATGCAPITSDATSAAVGVTASAGTIGHIDPVVVETSACPAGSVATGVQGREGLLVDQLQLLCSPLGPDGVLGPAAPAAVATGDTAGGVVAPPVSCAAGSVAVGVRGRSGDGLDYLALDCAGLSFVTDHALHFAGGTSGAAVTASDVRAAQGSGFTLAADVRWDGSGGVRGIVSQPNSDGAGNPMTEGEALLVQDGRPCLSLNVGNTPTLERTCAAAVLPVGSWVHLAGSYDGQTATIAVDGVSTPQTWPSAQPVAFGQFVPPLVIGRLFAADVANGVGAAQLSGFGGDVDNVVISAGIAPAALTGLAAYDFDEGSGSTTADGSGNGAVATLTGTGPGDLPQWIARGSATGPPDNTSWPTALTLPAGTGVDDALLLPGQARWYRFPVQPDSQVAVAVSHLPADYDVTLFKDIGQAFTALTTPSDLNRLSAEFAGDAFAPSVFSPSVFSPSVFSPSVFSPSVFSPSVYSPSVFSPSVFSPSVFSPSVFSPSVYSPNVFSPSVFSPSVFSPSVFSPSVFSPGVLPPAVLSSAFSSAQTRSIVAVSANDGPADESVSSNTWDNTGYFYVRVVGRDGASSPIAYHVQLTVTGGACTTTLDPRTDLESLTGTPGGARTVILTDYSRLHAGQADLATLRGRVAALAAATGGAVVDLEASPRVVALNAQADAVKDCPYAKNLVAQAARDIVNSYRDTAGTLKYVVLVGGDDVVPFFRYPDAAGLGPENGYLPPVADGTASRATLRRDTFLSQDAYGAATDVSIKGSVLPVPDLAVGRLVETPAEISGMISDYLGLTGGALPAATSSLVTGYDFLTSAADQVEGTLSAGIPGGRNDTLITADGVPPSTTTTAAGPSRSTSWTATDLKTALFGSRHDVTFLAGHFSANSALAADFSTQLVTTDLASAPAGTFKNTVVISAGCHSGYNLLDGDGIPGLTLGLDWPQAFAQQGATLVAGTGYQYGDTDFVAYSARLYALLAGRLRTGTGAIPLGAALAAAKQQYLSSTTQLTGIDVKSVLEATLYGLPMLGVNLPSRVSPTADTSTVSPVPVTSGPGAAVLASGQPGLGLSVADLAVAPAVTTRTRALTGTDGSTLTATYLSGPDGVVTEPAEPALPVSSVNVTVAGTSLRGVGLRSGSYTDTDGITPLTGAAATETNGVHAPFVSADFFPGRLATANYLGAIADPVNGPTRLAITPAQHRSDAPGSTTDTLRAYSALDFSLFYSANIATYGGNTPALAAPPSIDSVGSDAGSDGGTIPIRVHVTGDPSAGIQEVWVSYTGERASPLHGSWASVDLQQDPADSTLWTGGIALPAGAHSGDVRFLVQAVNGVGLVSMDDDQGAYYTPGQGDPAIASLTAPGLASLALTAPGTGTYGSLVHASAVLTGAGAPLAGRTVTFTLGGSARTEVTGADGSASADLPVLDVPGTYPLQADFAGDGSSAVTGTATSYGPATATSPGVAIVPEPTSLTLTGPAIAPTPGQDSGVQATLLAGGLPVREHPVYLGVTDPAGALRTAVLRTTDLSGRVSLGVLTLPAGGYTVTAAFGGIVALPGGGTTSLADPVLGSSAAALPLTEYGAPTIGGNPPQATAGLAYSYPLAVSGYPAPSVTLTTGTLPAGLTLSAGGVLSGTATRAGTFPLTVTASNGRAPTASATLTVVVGPGAAATLTTVAGAGQVGTSGQPFDTPPAVAVADGYGNRVGGAAVTFTVTAGSASFTGTGSSASNPRTATVTTGPTGVAVAPSLLAGTTPGPVTVVATLSATGGASPSATFALSVTSVPAARSDLRVAVSGPGSVARHGTFVATVTVTDLGPNTASPVSVALTLGPFLVVLSAPGSSVHGPLLTYSAGGLAVGATLTYPVTLQANVAVASTTLLVAAASCAVPDPRPLNNLALLGIRIT